MDDDRHSPQGSRRRAPLRLVGNRAGQTGIPLAVAGLSIFGDAAIMFATTGASLLASAWLSRYAPNDASGSKPDGAGS